MKAFLKASHNNWSMMGPGSWVRTTYSVFGSGLVRITEAYRPSVFNYENGDEKEKIIRRTEHIDTDTVTKLKAIIAELKDHYDTHMCCDGSAWEIISFNEDGSPGFHFEQNYIYGIDDLENLVSLLPK